MGSELEAANNPNSVPVLTAIQGLSLLSAYLKDDDLLSREHPHMLDGSKQFAWEKMIPLTSQDLLRSSH